MGKGDVELTEWPMGAGPEDEAGAGRPSDGTPEGHGGGPGGGGGCLPPGAPRP